MRKHSHPTLVLTLAALAALVSGCLGRSPAPRFYVLGALAEPGVAAAQEPQVVIGPIEVPAYLNRPQMVTRRDGGRLEVDELHRWAQPLAPAMQQVLADNVAALTGSQRVVPALTVRVREGYRVRGIVSRFEASESGAVVLEVTWAVRPLRGDSGGPVRRSVYTGTSADEPAARVAIMNQLLLRWSEDIAAELAKS